MHSVIEGGDIDVDDVAFANLGVVRDSMANHFVQRRAARFGKTSISERRGVCAVGNQKFMGDGIECVGGHTRFDGRTHQLNSLCGKRTCRADALDIRR